MDWRNRRLGRAERLGAAHPPLACCAESAKPGPDASALPHWPTSRGTRGRVAVAPTFLSQTRPSRVFFPLRSRRCRSPFRPRPPNVRGYQDVRGTWLGGAIAMIVQKPGHGVGLCGRPKRRRSVGRVAVAPALHCWQAARQVQAVPPAHESQRREFESSGTEHGAHHRKGDLEYAPSSGEGGAPRPHFDRASVKAKVVCPI
jgi:hypothetical protein